MLIVHRFVPSRHPEVQPITVIREDARVVLAQPDLRLKRAPTSGERIDVSEASDHRVVRYRPRRGRLSVYRAAAHHPVRGPEAQRGDLLVVVVGFCPMWLLAALWAYQIAAAAIFARIMKPRSKRDPMAEATLDISVTSSRGLEAGRSGRAPELTVEVRSTVYGSAIDWSAVANREQLTDQVMGVIAGMQPDARAWIERDLSELGWR